MTAKEVGERINEFQAALATAQRTAGLPCFILYAFHGGDAGTLGGEFAVLPGEDAGGPEGLEMLLTVVLLAYLQARLDVLKHESSATLGPSFTPLFQREVADQVQGMSATGTTALQQAVADLAITNRPCIALAAQPGHPAPDGRIRGDSKTYTATGKVPIRELIPVYAVLRRDLDRLVDEAAKEAGMDREKLYAMVNEMRARMPD